MSVIQFSKPGRPFAWKRPAQGRTKTGLVVRITDKLAAIDKAELARLCGDAWGLDYPWFGPVKLFVAATFAIPSSWPKPLQAAARGGEVYFDSDPDFDNIVKQVADAIKFIAFVDDCQIGDGRAVLRYGLAERTDVFLQPLSPAGMETPATARRRKHWKAGGYDRAIAKAQCGMARWPRVLDTMRREAGLDG